MADTPVLQVEVQPDVVVLRVTASDLFEGHVKALETELAAMAKDHSLPFVLDVTGVKIVPSLSLGVLVRLATDFRSRGQRIILAGPQPAVRQVLAITRIDRIFEVQESVDAAIRSVRPR